MKEKPQITRYSAPNYNTRQILLPRCNGVLSVALNANLFELQGAERELVFKIKDSLDEFEKAHADSLVAGDVDAEAARMEPPK